MWSPRVVEKVGATDPLGDKQLGGRRCGCKTGVGGEEESPPAVCCAVRGPSHIPFQCSVLACLLQCLWFGDSFLGRQEVSSLSLSISSHTTIDLPLNGNG